MSAEAEVAYVSAPALIDEQNLLRSVIRLAWPVIVQQVSFSMVQLVDTALVGHLGEDALAGVRLAGQLLWFTQAGMVAVGIGSTAIVARAVGAGEKEHASRVLQTAFGMALAWGILMGLAMFFLGGPVLTFLGAETAAQHDGMLYLRYAAIGMPFFSLLFAGNAAQQGAGDTRTPMVVGIIINIVNIIVAYALINGAWGAPKLGVKGSGIGFSASAITGCTLVLMVLASGTRILSWSPAHRFDGEAARRVLNVGVPAGIEQMQFNVAFLIYTAIIASLGTTALAAHGVTLAIQSLTFNIGFALGVATTALVGQSLGAGRPDLAEKSAYLTMRYSLLFMCTLGVLLMIFGGQITALFVGGEDADKVVHIGRQLLFIFAFAMPGVAVSLSLGGGLRGAGDTRAVLAIMAGSTWIVRLIPAYILAITLGLGVPGAWIMAVADITTRAGLMTWRFRMGKWKTIHV
ncbi:MAG TPA: MATE family efflux transporter [Dehalococcoidia bacterium]|nr:MATE family efflux transporter [Dehalococcoidia bacterium]